MRKSWSVEVFVLCLIVLVALRAEPASSRVRRAPASATTPEMLARATALRHLGIVPFAIHQGAAVTQAQVDQLNSKIAEDLSAMSYVDAKPVNGSITHAARADLLKSVSSADLDGVIIGEVTPDKIAGLILSRNGETLAPFAVTREISLTGDAQVRTVSRAVVDEIARAIPYRGFVTRQTDKDRAEINLGKNQGLIVGQRFRLFDFATASLSADRRDLGEVQVVEVADSTAIIEPTGAGVIKPFAKIGFNENAHGMAIAQQVETRGSIDVGGSLLNISGTADPKYLDRAYNVSSAPGFTLGGGWNQFAADLLFAQAKGDNTDFVYIETILNDRVYDRPFGGLNRFSIWAGARVARVSITTKSAVTSPLQSTTSISPEAQARIDRIIRGPVRGFIAVSAYYPIFVSGMDAGALFFSYGIGGEAGLSLDLSQRLFLDAGGRYHSVRRPVEAQSAVQESYTELFADLGYRF